MTYSVLLKNILLVRQEMPCKTVHLLKQSIKQANKQTNKQTK